MLPIKLCVELKIALNITRKSTTQNLHSHLQNHTTGLEDKKNSGRWWLRGGIGVLGPNIFCIYFHFIININFRFSKLVPGENSSEIVSNKCKCSEFKHHLNILCVSSVSEILREKCPFVREGKHKPHRFLFEGLQK